MSLCYLTEAQLLPVVAHAKLLDLNSQALPKMRRLYFHLILSRSPSHVVPTEEVGGDWLVVLCLSAPLLGVIKDPENYL